MRDGKTTQSNGSLDEGGDVTTHHDDVTDSKLNDLLVPVEPYLENRIQEFGLNGEESYVQSVSLGDKLLSEAAKIDYKFVINKEDKTESGPSEHPWTEVLRDLNSAHTEVCVLSDLMALLQQRQFLMLDAVQRPPPTFNMAQVIVAKKMGLRSGANILQRGVENMQRGNIGRFHHALYNMSSRFRIKKQGTYILGDASYRSCGSEKFYNEEALFEVTRNEDQVGFPLKLQPDPAVKLLSYLTISESRDNTAARFPVPSYWRHIPFPHVQVLSILYTIFTRELYHLMTVDCMNTSFSNTNYMFFFSRGGSGSSTSVVCRAVENLISIRLIDQGETLYVRRHVAPAFTPQDLERPSPILTVQEICLQHHLHKRHKMCYEEDVTNEGMAYSTMVLGIANNKVKLPPLLNFVINNQQHRINKRVILEKLEVLATTVKEPRIMIRHGACCTPNESSINLSLSPISRIATNCRAQLRVTVCSSLVKSGYQIESSVRGSVFSGTDCQLAVDAIRREICAHLLHLFRITCTHNLWGILSVDPTDLQLFAQCPNKKDHLTLTVTPDFGLRAEWKEKSYQIKRLPGRSVVQKLTTFLHVVCAPYVRH